MIARLDLGFRLHARVSVASLLLAVGCSAPTDGGDGEVPNFTGPPSPGAAGAPAVGTGAPTNPVAPVSKIVRSGMVNAPPWIPRS